MSPRAAWRRGSLGFKTISDYVDGKIDWMAAGMPTEGTNAELPRAGDVARKDAVTCRLYERLATSPSGPAPEAGRPPSW